jgi:hypothetical protein
VKSRKSRKSSWVVESERKVKGKRKWKSWKSGKSGKSSWVVEREKKVKLKESGRVVKRE